MLKEIEWPENLQYRSGTDREPIEFYLNAFCNSTSAEILLGYFSFSAIHVLALGFAVFISKGGRLRIVANHILSKEDKETLLMANEPSPLDGIIDITDVSKLRNVLDEYGIHFFECMAWMIANKRVEIVIIKPKETKGIAHYKSGVFSDSEDKVCFYSSCNFTAYGMLENLEQLNVDLEWTGESSYYRIISEENTFRGYFEKSDHSVDYIPVEDIETAIQSEFGGKDLDQLLIDEKKLVRLKSEKLESHELNKFVKKIENQIDKIKNTPRFPFPTGPREYQKEAYYAWLKNDKKGVFAMATGTGKTITSLNCLLNEYQKEKTYNAIILVPSIALLNQWESEVQSFNFQSILKVGGGNNWEKELATYVSNFSWNIENDLVIISTYGSFVTDRFQKYFQKIQSKLLLIADEAHNMGANNIRKLLPDIKVTKRIGLSATPKRIYDDVGTEALDEFFSDTPPYIYQFGMERALKEGFLTEYVYYPILVELEEDELAEYMEISIKLLRFFDAQTGAFKNDPMVEILLLKRKNIIHKAARKILAFKSIVQELRKKDKLKYVFTYVPEGYVTSVEGEKEKMLDQFIRAGSEVESNLRMNSYTASDTDLQDLLRGFSEGRIELLFAMKMLDEGVDIPRAEVGIFCSSTGNPRQFIQRRGRLLRKHKDKAFATIYDMVVVPKMSGDKNNYFNMERSMVKKELQRVGYFASLSMNFYDSKAELENVCRKYELSLDQIIEEL